MSPLTVNKRQLTVFFILLLCCCATLQAQPTVKSTAYISKNQYIPSGITSDEQHIADITRVNGDLYRISKSELNAFGKQTFDVQAEYIKEAAISPDGQTLVWLENNHFITEDDQLKTFDFSTEIISSLPLPQIPDQPDAQRIIKNLQFIKDTGQLSYLIGEGPQQTDYQHIVIQNIASGQTTLIEQLDLPLDYGWLVLHDHAFSDDGSRVLYYAKNRYAAGDCCFTDPGYQVLLDTASESALVTLNLTTYSAAGGMALAGDGQSFVYQQDEQLVQYDVSSDQASLLNIGGLADRLYGPIPWMALSADGSVLALSVKGDFADGNVFDQQKQFSEFRGGDFKYALRPAALMAVQLETGQTELLNKYNGAHLYPVIPDAIKADGSAVYYASMYHDLSSSSSPYYVSVEHAIEYRVFQADEALTGAWFDGNNPGQGLVIQVAPNPAQAGHTTTPAEGSHIPVVSWYTVDNQGQPFWLVMQGEFADNTLTGPAYWVSGSQFGANFQSQDTVTTLWGEITITFDDCRTATLSYNPVVDGFDAGQMNLNRLTAQAGLGCL